MKRYNKKRYQLMSVILLFVMAATACQNKEHSSINTANAVSTESGNNENNENDNSVINVADIDMSELFSNRDLSGDYDLSKCGNITLSDTGCTTDSPNAVIDKGTVTITGEGDYIIDGSISDGMIIVDVDKTEKVQLVLNGVCLNSASSAAIYVKKADKVFVTLADGTENTLTNGGSFTAIDDNNIDAVIFAKDDLTLNGTGALTISSPAGHGIVSKNELVIAGGIYDITAASHGMTGKDSVAIADGSFRIEAGEDAIKSVHDSDDSMGSVHILGGNYRLAAQSDGINALNEINISGGSIVVEKSNEGLEARIINISGGEVDITSSDDGLNATDKRSDSSKADATAATNDSGADIVKADTAASDKALDKKEDRNFDRQKKGFGGGMGDTQSDASINISGGVVRINAEGDGVDSNGYLTVSGGEVYVMGSSGGGDGALDYGIDASISGGIVVAAGQSNMAQNFGADSTQGAILVNTQEQNEAGSDIILLDDNGNELLVWTMKKRYNSVTISCPEIKKGSSYTVKMGGTSTEVTMNELIYGDGFSFGGGRRGFEDGERLEGMPEPADFENGERPEGMPEPPELENGERPEGMPEPADLESSEKKIRGE